MSETETQGTSSGSLPQPASHDALPRRNPWCSWATEPHHLLPYPPKSYIRRWRDVKTEFFSGIMIAFTQVSESIAFAFIAGIGPLLGLHAAWIVGLFTSVLGSTPSIINSANGVGASILANVVPDYGVEYVFYIVTLSACLQLLAGSLKVARFVRFLPRTAIIGFLNGLAIVFIIGQVRQFQIPKGLDVAQPAADGSCVPGELRAPGEWRAASEVLWMIATAIVTIIVVIFVPRIPRVGNLIPAALIGLLAAIGFEYAVVRTTGYCTPAIGDLGKMDSGLPKFFFLDPQYEGRLPEFNWDLIRSIIYPAFLIAAAGIVEMMMTMDIIGEMTSLGCPRPNHEILALGVGNIFCGLLGTMGGGPCIGLCMINCHNGASGRYRISGFVASMGVLTIVLAGSSIIQLIPTASLVGVMVIVIYHTFEWQSIRFVLVSFLPESWRNKSGIRRIFGTHNKISRIDALVILLVSTITLLADIFTATMVGAFLSAAYFAWKSGARMHVTSEMVMIPPTDDEIRRFRSLHQEEKLRKKDKVCHSCPPEAKESSLPLQVQDDEECASKDTPLDDDAINVSVVPHSTKPSPAESAITESFGGPDGDSSRINESKPNVSSTADADEEKEDSADPGLSDEVKIYRIHGPLLFTSSLDFIRSFDYDHDPKRVEIHFKLSQVDDFTALYALNKVAEKYKARGVLVHLRHLSRQSSRFMKKAEGLHFHFTYAGELEAEDGEVEPELPLPTHLNVEEATAV